MFRRPVVGRSRRRDSCVPARRGVHSTLLLLGHSHSPLSGHSHSPRSAIPAQPHPARPLPLTLLGHSRSATPCPTHSRSTTPCSAMVPPWLSWQRDSRYEPGAPRPESTSQRIFPQHAPSEQYVCSVGILSVPADGFEESHSPTSVAGIFNNDIPRSGR